MDPRRDAPCLPTGQPVADAGRGSGLPHRTLLSNAVAITNPARADHERAQLAQILELFQ